MGQGAQRENGETGGPERKWWDRGPREKRDRGPRKKSGETGDQERRGGTGGPQRREIGGPERKVVKLQCRDHREKRRDRGPTKKGDRGPREKSGETGDHREKRWHRGLREKSVGTGGPERKVLGQVAQREK